MFSEKKSLLFFISMLIVLLSLSLFVVNAHAQYPWGQPYYQPMAWGAPYQPYQQFPYQMYNPYQRYPYQPYNPYQQYQPYNPYQQYQPYNPYQQYQPYNPYQQYQPYNPYQQYQPYNPYQQYQPYNPYQQYQPYNPYQQYQPYNPYQQYPYQQYQPNYQQADLMLDSTDDNDDFTVDKGDSISVILASNPSTGYGWVLDAEEPDTDIVSKVSNQSFQGYTGMVGAAGSEQWIFEAEDVGTTKIVLYYKRAWETSVQDTFEVEITVE